MDLDNCISSREDLICRVHDSRVLPLVFGINKGFLPQLGVMMLSILKHNSQSDIHFYIFLDEIDKSQKNNLKTTVEQYDHVSLTICIVNSSSLSNILTTTEYPKTIFYRLLAAKYLDSKEQYILYLDADTLCTGHLDELYNWDEFTGKPYWGCIDSGAWLQEHKQRLGIGAERQYFNSGVLLICLSMWNEMMVSEKMLDLLQVQHFTLPDQDALNVLFGEQGGILPKRYNQFYLKNKTEIVEIPEETVIVHFAGEIKPWHYWCKHPIKKVWEENLRNSEWHDYTYKIRNYKENRKMASYLMKEGKFGPALKWYGRYVFSKIREKWI